MASCVQPLGNVGRFRIADVAFSAGATCAELEQETKDLADAHAVDGRKNHRIVVNGVDRRGRLFTCGIHVAQLDAARTLGEQSVVVFVDPVPRAPG